MDKETSVRLDAPEGHMLVNRKLKAIGRIVRTRTEWSGDWEVLLEAEAEALDKEWHPEFYGRPPEGGRPDPKPETPPAGGSGSGADFVDKVHEKLEGK
nr:MAG TPA: hypothetical protein [Caudoviricetes sp.]